MDKTLFVIGTTFLILSGLIFLFALNAAGITFLIGGDIIGSGDGYSRTRTFGGWSYDQWFGIFWAGLIGTVGCGLLGAGAFIWRIERYERRRML